MKMCHTPSLKTDWCTAYGALSPALSSIFELDRKTPWACGFSLEN